jgi:hypothetical protein
MRAGATFTVSASSADVYNSPTVASIVIGHAEQGAVFEITRELGSWVRWWPSAKDGVGYLHVSFDRFRAESWLPDRSPRPPRHRRARLTGDARGRERWGES